MLQLEYIHVCHTCCSLSKHWLFFLSQHLCPNGQRRGPCVHLQLTLWRRTLTCMLGYSGVNHRRTLTASTRSLTCVCGLACTAARGTSVYTPSQWRHGYRPNYGLHSVTGDNINGRAQTMGYSQSLKTRVPSHKLYRYNQSLKRQVPPKLWATRSHGCRPNYGLRSVSEDTGTAQTMGYTQSAKTRVPPTLWATLSQRRHRYCPNSGLYILRSMAQTICYTRSMKNDTDGIAQTMGYTQSIETDTGNTQTMGYT